MAERTLSVRITGDPSSLSRAFKKAHGDASAFSKGLGALKLGAIGAAGAIGVTFAGALKTGFGELMQAQKVSAQTAATLKSTGMAAGVTQKQIEGLSSALQAQTGISDDSIQSAQNLLLTFTKIHGETFPRATRAALDMSVAFGTNLNSSALMLGKALNDPIKGISALTRVGVSFTAQQKEQVKAMVEAGRTADAQKLILRELETQVGGSSRAFGQTLPGKLERLKRAWEDTSQSIAVAFVPVLEKVANGLLANQDKVQAFANGVAKAVDGVVTFVGALIKGDWKTAWDTAASGAGKTFRAIGKLAEKILFPLARKAGEKIVEGLAAGVDAGLQKVPGSGALRRILGFESADMSSEFKVFVNTYGGGGFSPGSVNRDAGGGSFSPPNTGSPRQRKAAGGFLPGVYTGKDNMLIHAATGEAVLTPQQQAMIPGGRNTLTSIFRATGGAYASGGYVQPVPGGDWKYGPGGGTHSRSEKGYKWYDDDAWDIMGSEGTPVYAGFSGTIGRISPFNPDGRYWGHGLHLYGGPGELFYKHLRTVAVKNGQRVEAGTLLGTLGDGVNGGAHLHLGAKPISLLSALRSGASPGSGGGGTSEVLASELSPGQKVLAGLSAAGMKPTVAKGILKAFKTGIGSGAVSDSIPGGSGLSSAQDRAVAVAGRSAAAEARTAGKSPSDVIEAQRSAERNAELGFLDENIKSITKAMTKLVATRTRLSKAVKALRKKKKMAPGKKREALVQLLTALATIKDELQELSEMRAELRGRKQDLGEQIEQDSYDAGYDDGTGSDTIDALELAKAEASLTDTKTDDIQAAKSIEDYWQAEYQRLKAAGDISGALSAFNNWQSAKSDREAIEATNANTAALNANTDALNGSGSSTVISYRGQTEGLRSIAMPASDRLTGIENML